MQYKVLNEKIYSLDEFRRILSDAKVSDDILLSELDRLYEEWKSEGDFYFFLEEEYHDLEQLKSATGEIEFFRLLIGDPHRGVALLAAREEKRQEERHAKEKEAKRIAKEKDELKSGKTKTIVLPGGAEMEMIYCAPGSFMMGSPEDEEGRYDDETQHKVTLTKGFWLGKYPVTQAQWESVMGHNPSGFDGDDNPVDSVSWDDCKEFIANINSRSDFTARFPTEAEWEYACRAGNGEAYSGTGDLDEMGWYDENSDDETHPVGEKEPNDWGFYDMHGNVLEWCADRYGSYSTKAVTDPKGPSSGGRRVLRGGSRNIIAGGCRSAFRRSGSPVVGSNCYGFRLCCSAGSHE